MAPDSNEPLAFEIAHVLFMDIVAYSTLPMDQQTLFLRHLQDVVRGAEEVCRTTPACDQLIRLPTGDGMALVFFGDPVTPVKCALEIGRALGRDHPEINLRMGVHSGPVYRVADINANRNVAGGGINIAQRVMDCGDTGHILVSKTMTDFLSELSTWAERLHDLGEAEVKHGARVHIFNLYTDEVGNPDVPGKLRAAAAANRATKMPGTASSAGGRRRSGRAIDSLAVLPLANASADPNTEYLSDGITESIINNLSQLPKLRVMARSTVFRYKGQEVDPQAVGYDLGVLAVMTGRVLHLGGHLIVKTELVDVTDGSQLWGEQYDRKLSDIFAVQTEISQEITEKLRLKLSGEQKKRLTKRFTNNAEAYQLYLKGRYFWNKRTPEGLKKGIGYFNQAIDRDPGYALAYAGLADSYALLSGYISVLPPKESWPKAKAAATKALEIDETLAEAHTSLAYVTMSYDWDWARAEREFNRAIELSPGYATAHHWYSVYLRAMGRFDESIAESERAQALDPLSLIINMDAGLPYYYARQYDRAIEHYRKTLEMDANFGHAHFCLGWAYEQKGMHEEAIAELQKASELSGRSVGIIAALGRALAVAGRRREAQEILGELKEKQKQQYVFPYDMAIVYAGLGERDQAFEWLGKACAERDVGVIWIKVDPMLDSLRADARFADLLRRAGFTP